MLVDVRVLDLFQKGDITSTGVLIYLTMCRNRTIGVEQGPTEIGKALGVGASTVNRQVRALRGAGLISGFSPRVVP